VKPPAVEVQHPIMREHENQEPHQQYPIVDDGTPQKKMADHIDGHLLSLRRLTQPTTVGTEVSDAPRNVVMPGISRYCDEQAPIFA
jgi:hypothetical protein